MKLFKSLFKSKQAEESEKQKSPPAAPSRSGTAAPDFSQRVWTPRSPRLRHFGPRVLVFRAPSAEPVPVLNLSATGLALSRKNCSLPLGIDSELEGQLELESFKHALRMKVVRMTDDQLGCAFPEASEDIRQFLLREFRFEYQVASLTPVNPAMLKKDDRGSPTWIRGQDDFELFYVSEGNRILSFQIVFNSNHIEGGEGVPTRFSQVKQDDSGPGIHYKGSAILQKSSLGREALLDLTVRFLRNVDPVLPPHREHLLQLLQNPPSA